MRARLPDAPKLMEPRPSSHHSGSPFRRWPRPLPGEPLRSRHSRGPQSPTSPPGNSTPATFLSVRSTRSQPPLGRRDIHSTGPAGFRSRTRTKAKDPEVGPSDSSFPPVSRSLPERRGAAPPRHRRSKMPMAQGSNASSGRRSDQRRFRLSQCPGSSLGARRRLTLANPGATAGGKPGPGSRRVVSTRARKLRGVTPERSLHRSPRTARLHAPTPGTFEMHWPARPREKRSMGQDSRVRKSPEFSGFRNFDTRRPESGS